MSAKAKEKSVEANAEQTELNQVDSSPQVEQTEQKETVETVIYTGDSLPGGTLQQFSVFKNGIPKSLGVHIEKCPAIKELLVPIASLSETRSNLSVQGSREHTLNAQIQAYARGDK